jgi:hypothetical protein
MGDAIQTANFKMILLSAYPLLVVSSTILSNRFPARVNGYSGSRRSGSHVGAEQNQEVAVKSLIESNLDKAAVPVLPSAAYYTYV